MHRKPCEIYAAHAPRVGDMIHYRGEPVGYAVRVDGALCWRQYPDADPMPFVWVFHDGVNALHDWPARAGAKVAPFPNHTGKWTGTTAGDPTP